jgi:hypothetical protein
MRFTKRREADAGQRNPPVPRAPLRNAPEDWRRFDAGSIPTKESTPHLDAFLQRIRQASPDQPLTLLDVGCGD